MCSGVSLHTQYGRAGVTNQLHNPATQCLLVISRVYKHGRTRTRRLYESDTMV